MLSALAVIACLIAGGEASGVPTAHRVEVEPLTYDEAYELVRDEWDADSILAEGIFPVNVTAIKQTA